ncbi:MAG TPA: four helix bundle protein [Bacteroidota bacterium]|nr:four helix bundle protein [Bacteroidota bacterium]
MQDFKRLKVWDRAHRLTLEVYSVSKRFPKDELFGLTSQIRRAASSVAANIAEGSGRRSNREFTYFLGIAIGSVSEVEYFLILAKDLNYVDQFQYKKMDISAGEIKRMLISLLKKVEQGNRTT